MPSDLLSDLVKLREECLYWIAEPDKIELTCLNTRSIPFKDCFILGDQFNRLIYLECDGASGILISLSQNLTASPFAKYINDGLANWTLLNAFVAQVRFSEKGRYRLLFPRIRLVALYHQENFPLPRFPLAISDIAASIRQKFSGQVRLSDMQLGNAIPDLLEQVEIERPDIIGISATFGQQDLLEKLIAGILEIEKYNPLIVTGGSLPVLNKKELIDRYPQLIVATGYGESTMQDIVEYWHGERKLEEVNSIQFRSETAKYFQTLTRKNDRDYAAWPELDLLRPILSADGVMQLEVSRGCTYACSFCPRDHKGVWSDMTDKRLPVLLKSLRKIYNDYPHINRRLFLVDEEFVGYKGEENSIDRGLQVNRLIAESGFSFESSTRIDQVVRPHKDEQWHIGRIGFWRDLITNGLSRMLFGVESGVDTILERFNKKTSSEQNTLAVRTLTALGVPLRLTYITFDPLMTMDELIESYRFQGRMDIILRAQPALSAEELYGCVRNQEKSEALSAGIPLFKEISYMLVSMECLLGSPYLLEVEKAGLAGEISLSMGRKKARYRDPVIGWLSHTSQLWVDRSFAFDYLLKSLIKISSGESRKSLRQLRRIIKEYAYSLLGKMLCIVNDDLALLSVFTNEDEKPHIRQMMQGWLTSTDQERPHLLQNLLDQHFDELVTRFDQEYALFRAQLPEAYCKTLDEEKLLWRGRRHWELINQ